MPVSGAGSTYLEATDVGQRPTKRHLIPNPTRIIRKLYRLCSGVSTCFRNVRRTPCGLNAQGSRVREHRLNVWSRDGHRYPLRADRNARPLLKKLVDLCRHLPPLQYRSTPCSPSTFRPMRRAGPSFYAMIVLGPSSTPPSRLKPRRGRQTVMDPR